jgi:hypothetical protein
MKFAEHCLVVLGTDPAAIVAHIDTHAAISFSQCNLDLAVRAVAELDGVRQQIEHDLDHAVEVHGHRRYLVRKPGFDLDIFFPE